MTHIFIEARYEKTSEYVFLDTVIRNLGSPALQPLKDFLSKNIS